MKAAHTGYDFSGRHVFVSGGTRGINLGIAEAYAQAGAAVSVLKSLSSEELNEFIESKVHTDVEGIRINGAITGLAAGGLFYFLLEYAYIPFMHQFM